jgi:hypothetical protein
MGECNGAHVAVWLVPAAEKGTVRHKARAELHSVVHLLRPGHRSRFAAVAIIDRSWYRSKKGIIRS